MQLITYKTVFIKNIYLPSGMFLLNLHAVVHPRRYNRHNNIDNEEH